jgi:penicillin amidase
MVPREKAPLDRPVTIHWDDHQIPFIEASTDHDAATALGIVHAQLRLGQLEVLRRLSHGRLAEMIGAAGVDIDRQLRTLDSGRVVPGMLAMMPSATRDWLEAFARGINHQLMRAPSLPPEFSLFALQREPWTAADVLTVGRLMSADVNWLVWLRLLQFRRDPDWPALWRKLAEADSLSFDSAELLGAPIRSGSNSLVIGAGRTQSGAPVIANDPHLPLVLPNPWLIAALKSPSYNVVGLMLPGLPFVALGRNPWIAWGGTSLHAASSDVVAVSNGIEETEQQIKVRWGRPRTVKVRNSPSGPVMTETLALRWMGHRPSDEVTAMLAVNRARNWDEYRAALDGFSVPGQNMLYADTEGHIGKLMAVHLPRRARFPSDDLVLTLDRQQGWDNPITGGDLPHEFDPAHDFIASANERPPDCGIFIGHQFSRPDRRRRLDHLLSSTDAATIARAIGIQGDVHWQQGLAQCQQLLRWLPPVPARQQQLVDALASWDGNYTSNSRGALAFELLNHALAHRLVSKRRLTAYSLAWGTRRLVWSEIVTAPSERRQRALQCAVRQAARSFGPRATWGSRHRLRLGHPLSMLPVIGRRWRFTDLAIGGGNDTLMKTAHGLTDRIHGCGYGSTARHISDLSDPDLNLFALAGGQDGWPGSTTFIDQVRPFVRNEYIAVPLRAETARATFAHRMDLTP